LPIAEAAPEIEVIKSNPKPPRTQASIAKDNIYKKLFYSHEQIISNRRTRKGEKSFLRK
jgi:hypothetical protein